MKSICNYDSIAFPLYGLVDECPRLACSEDNTIKDNRIQCIRGTWTKMEVIKVFLNGQCQSSFHVIGQQVEINYLRLALEELSTC